MYDSNAIQTTPVRFDPAVMNWHRISTEKPLPGSRVIVFTPVMGSLRFRLMDAELLNTASEATHWAYVSPPTD